MTVDAAKKALDEGYTLYTPNAGYKDLRESVSRKVLKDNIIHSSSGGTGGLATPWKTQTEVVKKEEVSGYSR